MATDRPLHETEQSKTHLERGRFRCAICMHSLNVEAGRDGVERLAHGPLPSSIEAHEPVPEPMKSDFDIIAACDFCSTEIPFGFDWTIPAQSFSYEVAPNVPVQNSIGGWACCQECATDYAAGNFGRMAERWLKCGAEGTGVYPPTRQARRDAKRSVMAYWRTLKNKYALGPPEPSGSGLVTDAQHRHGFHLP